MKAWQRFLLAFGVGALALEARKASAETTPIKLGLPRGKGLFIEGLIKQANDPQHLITRLKWLGIKWVAIEIAWFGPPGPSWTHDADGTTHNLEDGALAAFVPELEAAGIECWVWGFPSPDRQGRFVDYVKAAYQAAPQVRGVIIDPEKPYYGTDGTALEALIATLQDLGRPVGVTSYGRTGYHPAFPWQAIGGADFGIPQIYSDDIGDDYPQKAVDSWKATGITVVIPANGAYGKEHTPAEMTKQAELSDAAARSGAVIWWNYRLLVLDQAWDQAGRAAAVRDFQPEGS